MFRVPEIWFSKYSVMLFIPPTEDLDIMDKGGSGLWKGTRLFRLLMR